MASEGPNYPSSGANNTAVGTQAWSSTGNVTAADGSAAQASGVLGATRVTNYLVATAYGFAIPSTATIDGIVVEIYRRGVATGGTSASNDSAVRLWSGGATYGTANRAAGTLYTGSFVLATYGGASDLWGATPTPATINASGFGAALASNIQVTSGSHAVQVDYVRVTVYYTPAPIVPLVVHHRRMMGRG